MKLLNGFTLLLCFQLVGEVIARLLALPIPGPVIGMVLLFIGLLMFDQTLGTARLGASTILKHLSLFFVPAGVGLMTHFERIGSEWPAILLAVVGGTVISLLVTALLMKLLIRLGPSKEQCP